MDTGRCRPLLPAPKFFKVRAHANPLSDSAALDAPERPELMDWSTLYPRWMAAPVPDGRRVEWVDIGCGFGGLVATLAQQFPQQTILGMEIRDKVSAAAMDRIVQLRAAAAGKPSPMASSAEAAGLPTFENVAVLRSNCMRTLPQFFAKGQLTKICFCFPDPHFQEHAYRRRVISRGLLATYAYILHEGGLLYTVTDVIDLHEWHVRHIEEHPLFERVSPEKETAEHDPVVRAITRSTDESVKVAKVQGDIFVAVFRRVGDSAAGTAGASSFQTARQRATARILTSSRATGRLLQSAAGVPCPTSLADALTIQAIMVRDYGSAKLGEIVGWRAGESSLVATLVDRLPVAPIFSTCIKYQQPLALCRRRQNICRVVPHIALKLIPGRSEPTLSVLNMDTEQSLWSKIQEVGVVLEAVGARHTCKLEDQSAAALFRQRVADGGGSVMVALGDFCEAKVLPQMEHDGTLYCDLECAGHTVRSAVTWTAVAASVLAAIRSVADSELPLGSLLLVPAGKGARLLNAGDVVTARLSGSASGSIVSTATIALEQSEVLAVTRRHAYAREVRPKVIQGVNMRNREDIPVALGGKGGKGVLDKANCDAVGLPEAAGDGSANLAVLLGHEGELDPASAAARAVVRALQRQQSDRVTISDEDVQAVSCGRMRARDRCGATNQPHIAAVCEVVGLRVPSELLSGSVQCLSICGLRVHPIPDLHHGSRASKHEHHPAKQSAELGAACRQLMAETEQESKPTGHVFAVYGCGRDESFDPASECLRAEYEYLLPVSCLQPAGAAATKLLDASSNESVSMSADRWLLHGAGVLGTEMARDTLKWELPQAVMQHKGGSALITTKLDSAACCHVTEAGSSVEWCISRSAVCDVRVRLAVRQVGQPDGQWWVSREVAFPCALIEEPGQSEVKSQMLFGKTDTWQVLRIDPNLTGLAPSYDPTETRGTGEAKGRGRRSGKGGGQNKLKPQGKAVGLRAEWGGIVEIGWLVDGEADGAALSLKQLRVIAAVGGGGDSKQPEEPVLQRLTSLLRCFDGSPRLHNYTEDASTTDRNTHAQGVRCRNHGLIRLTTHDHEQDWIVISIAAPQLQVCQICRMVGVIATLLSQPATSISSDAALTFIEATLRPECVLPAVSTVCAPAALLYLTECKFKRWGGNRARRMGQDTAVARAIVSWRAHLQAKLATSASAQLDLWEPWRAAQRQVLGLLAEQAAQRAVLKAVRWGQPLPEGWNVPDFSPVLDRLRHMTAAGTWPPTPASRAHIFLPREEDNVEDAAGNHSSPPPCSITLTAETAASLGLTELWDESVRLEALIAPAGRSLPSHSVTINSHAQFRPHTDSVHGSRPSSVPSPDEVHSDTTSSPVTHRQPTLHVGLGVYTGGCLFVEGVEHDIRYTPLSYDGVSQRHWTAPFRGERYTLVWA